MSRPRFPVPRLPDGRALSPGHMLRQVGFEDTSVRDPLPSGIAGWRDFGLDTKPGGAVYLPSSLYIEGRRPDGPGERG